MFLFVIEQSLITSHKKFWTREVHKETFISSFNIKQSERFVWILCHSWKWNNNPLALREWKLLAVAKNFTSTIAKYWNNILKQDFFSFEQELWILTTPAVLRSYYTIFQIENITNISNSVNGRKKRYHIIISKLPTKGKEHKKIQ